MVPTPHRLRRGVAGALLVVLGLAQVSVAQTPPAEEVSLQLVTQPVWHGPGDDLGIRLKATNNGIADLEGFLLGIQVFDRVTTRSALHAMFEGSPGLFASGSSIDFPDMTIPAGEARVISVDPPVNDFPSLVAAAEGGVYPVQLTLGSGGVELASVTTPLIYYPSPPELQLGLSLVLPLNDVPSRGPTGSFLPSSDGGYPLETALSDAGWLSGVIGALERNAGVLPPIRERVRIKRRPGRREGGRRARPRFRTVERPRPSAHVALAPTPRLIEELADMADGYRREEDDETIVVAAGSQSARAASRALEILRQIAQEPGVQLLLVPYAFPDLPSLASGHPEHVADQLAIGRDVLRDLVPAPLEDLWLYPPAGRIDADTLSQVLLEQQHVFFNSDALEPAADPAVAGCPLDFATFACAASVRISGATITGLVQDAGLQQRFTDLLQGMPERLGIQNLLAETAAIYQEVPGVEGRVVHAISPAIWHPSPRASNLLLRAVRTAPWLRPLTPREALEDPDVTIQPRRVVTTLPPLRTDPGQDRYDQIADAADLVRSFDLIRPPTDLVTRLRRNVLVAESRAWWSGEVLGSIGLRYVTETRDTVERSLARLTIGGPSDIRLTSSQGEIPLVIFNEASFPATVDITVESEPDLELDETLIEDQRIEPRSTHQFSIRASARSSGIFQLAVEVETPDGSRTIARKLVRVRSTEFNEVALGITVGAFTFLVLFYGIRLWRRRSNRTQTSP